MPTYTVSKKVIISGQYVEFYEYERPYTVGKPRKPRQPRQNHPSRFALLKVKPIDQIRADNLLRTKKKIKRLVNSNQDLNKFLTLTFGENISDWNFANHEFKKFIQRVCRRFPEFKYVAVPEFQKRGAIHFHLVCNLKFLTRDELEALHQLWGCGWIDLKKIRSNMGHYMTKYLTKQNVDRRFFHKKKFFRSLKLLLPQIIQRFKEIKEFLKFLNFWTIKELLFEKQFDTFYRGSVKYKLYKL